MNIFNIQKVRHSDPGRDPGEESSRDIQDPSALPQDDTFFAIPTGAPPTRSGSIEMLKQVQHDEERKSCRHPELGSGSTAQQDNSLWMLNQVQHDASPLCHALEGEHDKNNKIVTPSAVEGSRNNEGIPRRCSGLQKENGMKDGGFTLIELAIALMVIGLLIGGVLKGQELINNARVTAEIRQINAYNTAVMIFQTSYKALPGDIRHPARIPNCTSDICTDPGNGNGIVNDSGYEGRNFFPHLTLANLITGPTGGSEADLDMPGSSALFYPESGFGKQIRIVYSDEPFSAPYQNIAYKQYYEYLNENVPVRYAAAMDRKMDDGNPFTGVVFTLSSGEYHYNGTGDTSMACYNMDDGTYVDNLAPGGSCPLTISVAF